MLDGDLPQEACSRQCVSQRLGDVYNTWLKQHLYHECIGFIEAKQMEK